jgi:putative transposase
MYVRFPLSLRQVEDLLHERGVDISHETVRAWWNRFGPMFAAEIKKRRVHHRLFSNWQWHLDEVFVRINGELRYLWRAVDYEGEVLESFVTKRRDRKAALRFMRKAMKRYGGPEVVVTDRLRSYRAAMKVIGNAERQETGRWLNNRAENSHQPFRRREHAMAKFRSAKSSNSIARSPLPNGVKLPLETTGGSDFLPRQRSSDSTHEGPASGCCAIEVGESQLFLTTIKLRSGRFM